LQALEFILEDRNVRATTRAVTTFTRRSLRTASTPCSPDKSWPVATGRVDFASRRYRS
jgi:hypothetical protein